MHVYETVVNKWPLVFKARATCVHECGSNQKTTVLLGCFYCYELVPLIKKLYFPLCMDGYSRIRTFRTQKVYWLEHLRDKIFCSCSRGHGFKLW